MGWLASASRFAREVLPPSNTSVICSQSRANCLQRLISVSVRLANNAASFWFPGYGCESSGT